MKECFKCHGIKPLTEFYRHIEMKDGHLNKCKDCAKSDVRLHRIVSERPREYDRERFKESAARREQAAETGRQWREKYPGRVRAQSAVTNAVRDGKINKPKNCEICNNPGRIHGHHEDYTKPLDVMWLCAKCHHGRHANGGK